MCYKQYSIGSCIIIFGTFGTNLPVDFLFFLGLCTFIYIYVCFLCIVICMHSFYSAHIFIICNSVPTHSIFDYGHIVLNYTAHIVYSPLNSYVYIHWIVAFKYYYYYCYTGADYTQGKTVSTFTMHTYINLIRTYKNPRKNIHKNETVSFLSLYVNK